jgi:hypothetical protein
MPRRTGKITHPDMESIESTEEGVEHIDQEDDQTRGQNMLELADLKNLVFLGRLHETVDIAGYKIVVTTLTANQQKEIMRNVMKIDQVERLLDIKPITVAYVTESINGVPLEDLCEDESITEMVDRRISVVNNMQAVLVERLYQVYERLVVAANEEVGLEDLKKL